MNIQDLFALWDPKSSLAAEIGEEPETVKKWWQRGVIPGRAICKVATAAQKRDPRFTIEVVSRLHDKPPAVRRKRRPKHVSAAPRHQP